MHLSHTSYKTHAKAASKPLVRARCPYGSAYDGSQQTSHPPNATSHHVDDRKEKLTNSSEVGSSVYHIALNNTSLRPGGKC